LKWFSADIGYHNIHHLSEKIPNYNLEACHNQNIHLLADVKTLEMADIPDCFKFILWDCAANQLVSIASFHQTVSVGMMEKEVGSAKNQKSVISVKN
jgi:omega-6 fatty acid desaturase (delta-12 desaturase)